MPLRVPQKDMTASQIIRSAWEESANAAVQGCPQPAVSVIISLYNYSAYIKGCLESVRASVTEGMPGGFEVVVVDDCSTDASLKTVEEYMAATSLPVRLVRKFMNSGLADTRNLGLLLARAPLVFILDADNEIRPNCLSAHYQALVHSSHALAYGIINRFDHATRECLGTMSHAEWDVAWLVSRPCIDAMAMIRREAVLQVGGYSTEYGKALPQGWEDYDLWLKLAQAGHSAKFIPQMLSDYRVHKESMLQQLLPRQNELATYFTRKFLPLVVQHAHLPLLFGIRREHLEFFCARGDGFPVHSRESSEKPVHRILGKKLCRSICKRLAKMYCWLYP
jgi:glycosyltransferase involved in cell wall biosynthesis